MKVSVIIPVYNCERYIAETVASALDQTLARADYEVIVVNDGSTDGSAAALAPFIGQVVYLEQANAGVSAARNAGIAAAKGEYLAFLDQDDKFKPEKLERLSNYLDMHPDCGLVYSPVRRIDQDGRELEPKRHKLHAGRMFMALFEKCYIAPSMVMARKTVLLEAGGFQLRYSSEGEDYDLFLKMAQLAPFGVIKKELGYYRVHPDNTCKTKQNLAPFLVADMLAAYETYVRENFLLGGLRYRRRMAKFYREQARVRQGQGRLAEARTLYSRALRTYPFRVGVWLELAKAVRA